MDRKLLALLAIAFLVAACAPTLGGPGAGSATTPAPAQPPGQPGPAPTAPMLPPCDSLLTEEDLALYFLGTAQDATLLSPIEGWGPPTTHIADNGFRALLEQAEEIESCVWGIPFSDAFFTIVMATLTPELASRVQGSLESSGFPEAFPPLQGYVYEDEDSASMGIHHLEGNLWLVFQGGPGSNYADHAVRLSFADLLNRLSSKINH